MHTRVFLQVILCVLLFTSTLVMGQSKVKVYTVNYPLQYFAQRIAGQHADVVFPAPAKGDPAFWQPSVEIISGYQQADLILLNGANYAKWVDRVALPRRKLVDTSAGFRDRYIHVTVGATQSWPRRGTLPCRHCFYNVAGFQAGCKTGTRYRRRNGAEMAGVET